MMLNREKGLVLRKLRMIQLVKDDLQLIIQIFLGLQNLNAIKNNY